MDELFEPEFVGLVNDDEQHLIVFWSGALRLLKFEQFVDLQVADVGDCFTQVTRLPLSSISRYFLVSTSSFSLAKPS